MNFVCEQMAQDVASFGHAALSGLRLAEQPFARSLHHVSIIRFRVRVAVFGERFTGIRIDHFDTVKRNVRRIAMTGYKKAALSVLDKATF